MKPKKEEIYNKLLDIIYIENKDWTPKQAKTYKRLSRKKDREIEKSFKEFMGF